MVCDINKQYEYLTEHDPVFSLNYFNISHLHDFSIKYYQFMILKCYIEDIF